MTTRADAPHLSEETLAAWVDGTLAGQEREQAAVHLVACDECRALALETRAVIRHPGNTRWPTRLAVGGFAAAAAVALLVLAPEPATTPGEGVVTRTNGASRSGEDTHRFAVYSPTPRGTIRPDTAVLRWEALEAGATYAVTISNARGDLVLRADTRDTTLSLAGSTAAFVAGETYYWVVDAQLPSLRSARTPLASFRVERP